VKKLWCGCACSIYCFKKRTVLCFPNTAKIAWERNLGLYGTRKQPVLAACGACSPPQAPRPAARASIFAAVSLEPNDVAGLTPQSPCRSLKTM